MLDKRTQLLLSLVALAMMPFLSGCLLAAAGVAGAATVAYVEGEIKTTLQATPPQVAAATNSAFKQMGIAVISSNSTAVDGRVEGRNAADKKIAVTIASEGDKASRVAIRVGTFGDESMSRQILDKIKSNL
jgi:hypothetical protein